ncbi:gamma-butyrobetaine dioxygenase-like [Lytechinus variegatus]|uniref:gamma-butyrobetaine dioxygenase-like n=1 Tax=Lytechinus variegatus TaxID=7654 RepID=UPI001BB1B3F1|nr:gamma-butyrobetaine dioxygenase-like [Lytechinus variegatus]
MMNSSKISDLNNNDGDNDPFRSLKSLCLDAYSTESIIFPASWKAFSEIEIEGIELATRSNDRLCVTWKGTSSSSSSSSSAFPLIWLRDNCRCPECFNPATLSRIAPLKNINGNSIKPEKVSLTDDKKFLIMYWGDGHVSHYPARWLRCNAFSESEPDPLADIQLQLWDASTCRDRMRKFDFDDVLSDDRILYEMFLEVKVLGIALVENTPLMTGQLNKLADKVGFLFPTKYGETFQVRSKENPSNGAYHTGDLPLHTDSASYNTQPGIQMLHCIKQAAHGGGNPLVDGFKVASDLRTTSPDSYDVLTKQILEFYDRGTDTLGEFYYHAKHYVLRLNEKNEVDRISFSDHGRSAMNRMQVDDVMKTYKALSSFTALLYAPENVFEYKMKDGDMLIMDNYRVLHGRKSFTVSPGSARHLEGGYFDWDTVMSKLRILKNNLEEP